jgi:hypothetical protein
MAKVPFTKLKCKINTDEVPVQIGEETIAVKQYLPIQEKLGLISRVIELAHMQDENYSNPVKAAAFRDLEVIFAYSNLSFTDKQKEDVAKLYDMLYSTGIMNIIIDNIPEDEYNSIIDGVEDSIEAVYKYQNSALGILNGIKESYSETEINVEDMQKAVKELADSPVLKNVMNYLA